MGAFQTGFGFGMQAWNNAEQARDRQLARERQDRLDQQNAEAASQTAKLNAMKIAEAQRLLDEQEGLRQAGSEIKGKEGFASGEAGQQIFSADKGQAETLAGINAAAAELETEPVAGAPQPAGAPMATGPAVRAATGVTGGGKPQIAGPGMKFDNSPEARVKRQADYLTSIGKSTEAQELQANFAKNQQALYDANRTTIFNQFTKTLYGAGVEEAIKLYDSYNDGMSVKLVKGNDGGFIIERYNEKTGDKVGEMTFKDADDLASQVRGMIFPEQRLAAIDKAANETVTVKPGEEILRGGKVVHKNTTPTSSEGTVAAALIRSMSGGAGGSGSGSGGSRGAKAPDTLNNQITSIIAEASKDADSAMRLSPDQMTQARAYGSMLANLNPNIDPNVAADVAMKITRDPTLVKPAIGDNGRIMGTYVGQDGKPIPVGNLDVSRLPPEARAALGEQAKTMLLNDIAGGDQETAQQFLRLAHGDKTALPQMRDEYVPAQAEAIMKADPNITWQQATDAAVLRFDQLIASQQGRLQAIRQLVPAPKVEARRAPPVQRPATGPAPATTGPAPATTGAAPATAGAPARQAPQGPDQVPVRPRAQPVQQAPAAPSAVQAANQPSLAEIIAGPAAGSSPVFMESANRKASQLQSIAQQIKDAQAQVVSAAKSGSSPRAAMDRVTELRNQAFQLTSGMNQQQAQRVLAAAGIK